MPKRKKLLPDENEKRNQILETARRLYYYNGADNVSFDEIAEECGITKPLIRYYFGSKSELIEEIFTRYSRELANVFWEKAFKLGPIYSTYAVDAAFQIRYTRYYLSDPKAFDFIRVRNELGFTHLGKDVESFFNISQYGPLSHRNKDSTNNEVRHMYFVGCEYASRGLVYQYGVGEIKCPIEEFDKFMMRIRVIGTLTEDQVDVILKQAYDLNDHIDIEFLPEFHWK